MKAALESSRRQINRTRKGILIVGSSANDTRLARVLEEEATHSISKKGRDRTGINAIMTMAPTFDLVPANTGTSVQFEVTPAFALNPHFNSEGFVRTTE